MRIRIPRDLFIATACTIVGLVIGFYISYHYYEKGLTDTRVSLLDGAITDPLRCHDQRTYPMYFDSVGFHDSGKPWPRLSTAGLEELFRHLLSFEHHTGFPKFADLVNDAKRSTDNFNDRINLRNFVILRALRR